MRVTLIDCVGVFGGMMFLLAFWRTSIGRWTGKSLWYELDNLVGAVCMSIYAYDKGAFISIALNTVWAIVAIRGVTSLAERCLQTVRAKRRR